MKNLGELRWLVSRYNDRESRVMIVLEFLFARRDYRYRLRIERAVARIRTYQQGRKTLALHKRGYCRGDSVALSLRMASAGEEA